MKSPTRLSLAFYVVLACTVIAAADDGDGVIEYELYAFWQAVSPIADGVVGRDEYSTSKFLSFGDTENPGTCCTSTTAARRPTVWLMMPSLAGRPSISLDAR